MAQAYAQKFYASRIKPLVLDDLKAMNPEDQPCYPIAVIKHNIKKAWDSKLEEVQCQVIKEVENASKMHEPASISV
ncbi:hypothetical protein C0995_000419 [Termitomyces sp. Mi166|nr:hypothetical protein C0995_000419 [Termitomyces sp. Mi166\